LFLQNSNFFQLVRQQSFQVTDGFFTELSHFARSTDFHRHDDDDEI
jgi:hypothetical protein